jgi:hypothetical protein
MKKILVVSDLHVGSNVAIMPEEVVIEPSDSEKAQKITANSTQKLLFKKWQEMIDHVGRVDGCFVMGDSCDGTNQKSRGFELWTTNMHQQVNTAADLLAMIKTNKYYGVQGSYYHVGENTSSDLAVIETLNSKVHGFGTDLKVELDNKIYHLAHDASFSSSPVSKATALQRELVSSKLYENQYGHIDMIVRGHRHEYIEVKNEFGHMVVAPCWKLRDAFAAKKGLSMSPMLGYVLLKQDGNDITTEPHTFEAKMTQSIKTFRM